MEYYRLWAIGYRSDLETWAYTPKRLLSAHKLGFGSLFRDTYHAL